MGMPRLILYGLLLLLFPGFAHAKIVFKSVVRGAGAGLYVMEDDGRNVRRITEAGWWPVWSPDGQQIAFSKSLPVAPRQPQKSAVFIINSDGSHEHRLTDDIEENLDGGRLFETSCSWAPDGRHIIFTSSRDAKPGRARSELYTIDLTTKEMRRLTRTENLTTFPAWSPDGKHIAYRNDSPNGQFTIYLMRADGSRQRELAPGDFWRRRGFPRWSPDSQSVVYYEDTFGQEGGRLVTLSRKAVIHHIETGSRQVVATPDDWRIHSACFMGSKHLLISAKLWNENNPNAEKYEIYRYHRVTGEIVNLTNTPGDDYAMDWISDDVLSVTPHGKKKVTWGAIKE